MADFDRDYYNETCRHFRRTMQANNIPFARVVDVGYVLFVLPEIDRFVTFHDGKAKIGKTRYDGSRSWRDADVINICAECIWLWNYYDCLGKQYPYADEPWLYTDHLKWTAEEMRNHGLPGRSKKQSTTPESVRKKWREQETERKNAEKERKRIERFEREIARRTRKTNR